MKKCSPQEQQHFSKRSLVLLHLPLIEMWRNMPARAAECSPLLK